MGISITKIAQRRTELGMSVSEFAKRVGISRKTYYDWENNAAPVSAKYGEIISNVLNLDRAGLWEEDRGKMPEGEEPGLSFDVSEMKKRTQWALNYIIAQHGLSNVKLASILDLSTSTIDSYRRGVKTPKFEVLAFLQNTYLISLDWLADGQGSKFIYDRQAVPLLDADRQDAEAAPPSDAGALPSGEFVFIPQMAGTISNGALAPDGGTEMRIAFRRDWISRKGRPQNMSLIKVQGDSMEPTLISGDLVLVDHSKDSTTRGGLFAITIDQEILIKRIQPLMGAKLLVISDNQKYTPLEIAADEIQINGKVIWFGREFER